VAGLQTGFAKIITKTFSGQNFIAKKKSGQTYRGRSSYFALVFAGSKRKGQAVAQAVSGVVMGETF
jgi:hypothetical protein